MLATSCTQHDNEAKTLRREESTSMSPTIKISSSLFPLIYYTCTRTHTVLLIAHKVGEGGGGTESSLDNLGPRWPHPVKLDNHQLSRHVPNVLANDRLGIIRIVRVWQKVSVRERFEGVMVPLRPLVPSVQVIKCCRVCVCVCV